MVVVCQTWIFTFVKFRHHECSVRFQVFDGESEINSMWDAPVLIYLCDCELSCEMVGRFVDSFVTSVELIISLFVCIEPGGQSRRLLFFIWSDNGTRKFVGEGSATTVSVAKGLAGVVVVCVIFSFSSWNVFLVSFLTLTVERLSPVTNLVRYCYGWNDLYFHCLDFYWNRFHTVLLWR